MAAFKTTELASVLKSGAAKIDATTIDNILKALEELK